jgi:chromosome segregation ATPase
MARTSYKDIYDMDEWELKAEIRELRRLKSEVSQQREAQKGERDRHNGNKRKYDSIVDAVNRMPNLSLFLRQSTSNTNKYKGRITKISQGYEYVAPYVDKIRQKEKEMVTNNQNMESIKRCISSYKSEADRKRNEIKHKMSHLKGEIDDKKRLMNDLQREHDRAVRQWDKVKDLGPGGNY